MEDDFEKSRYRGKFKVVEQDEDTDQLIPDYTETEDGGESDQLFHESELIMSSSSSPPKTTSMPSNRRKSFAWNTDFTQKDMVKRRRSIGDPQELRRQQEFSALRYLGESREFTNAWDKLDTSTQISIQRRFSSSDFMTEDMKNRVLGRITFSKGRRKDEPVEKYSDEEDSDDSDDSVMSDGSDQESRVIYRVSIAAGKERADEIQALLTQRAKSIRIEAKEDGPLVLSSLKPHSALPKRSNSSTSNASHSKRDDKEEDPSLSRTRTWRDPFTGLYELALDTCIIL